MDTSQIILLEDELNDCIVDQQEEAQIEPTHGSPNKSNTPSKYSKEIVEVPEIVLEDEFIGWILDHLIFEQIFIFFSWTFIYLEICPKIMYIYQIFIVVKQVYILFFFYFAHVIKLVYVLRG